MLDILLPGCSGYEVLRRLCAQGVWSSVLMLTAKEGGQERACHRAAQACWTIGCPGYGEDLSLRSEDTPITHIMIHYGFEG